MRNSNDVKRLRQMVLVHLKAVRWPLIPVIMVALGMPMYILRIIQTVPPEISKLGRGYAADVLRMQDPWIALFPVLACIVGGMIGLTAWSWDHQSRHIYPLSLPVSRARYVLLKMAAGFLVLLIPVMALFAGTLLGLAFTHLPPELHGYPFSFTARFLLASVILYAVVFALASTTARTTGLVLAALVIIFLFGSMVTEYARSATGNRNLISPGEMLFEALTDWPGPFNVFGGSWMMIDA